MPIRQPRRFPISQGVNNSGRRRRRVNAWFISALYPATPNCAHCAANAAYDSCTIVFGTCRTHAERPRSYGRVGGRVAQKLARHWLSMWQKVPTSRGVWLVDLSGIEPLTSSLRETPAQVTDERTRRSSLLAMRRRPRDQNPAILRDRRRQRQRLHTSGKCQEKRPKCGNEIA
jgi:hypothetical protein